jgi:hypothetical protein
MDAAERLPGGMIDHRAIDTGRLRRDGRGQHEKQNRRSHNNKYSEEGRADATAGRRLVGSGSELPK